VLHKDFIMNLDRAFKPVSMPEQWWQISRCNMELCSATSILPIELIV
jgi:hypothetical protein